MPYGAEYWAPQTPEQEQDPRKRPGMQIPTIEDYYTPMDSKMAADEMLRHRLASRGPVAQIGSHGRGTVIDLGAAAGIISDIVAAKKAEKMGAPAQARYESAKWAYERDAAEKKAQEMAEDRRIDNERQAARDRAVSEDRRMALESLMESRRLSAEDRDAMREQLAARDREMVQYRQEMLGFRKSELGMSGARLSEDRRQFNEAEGRRREEFDLRKQKTEVDPVAGDMEKQWMKGATDPKSIGGIAITEGEKDQLRQLRSTFQRQVKSVSPGAVTSQTVKPAAAAAPKPAAATGKFREGQTATGPNGQKVVFRGGAWQPLQ